MEQNGFLINKMPEIKNIIAQHQPQILGVSEANMLDIYDASLAAVQDYTLTLEQVELLCTLTRIL